MKGFLSFIILAFLAVQTTSIPLLTRKCNGKDCYPHQPPIPGGKCSKDSSRGYYPHPTDCNKFIQCVHGKDQEMQCAAGLNWNDKAMVCDWPDKAGCKGGSGGSGGSGCSGGNGSCGGSEGGGSEGGSGGSECSNGGCGGSGGGGATEGQCAKDSGRGFYPHSSDCNKFIICDHGKDKEMTCPGNQHWNDKILACDLPEKAGCKDSSGGSGESGCSGGNGGCAGCGSGGSGCTNGTGGCGGSECGGSSGSQCAKEPNRGYYPHPSDCNKFIQCVNGKDQEMPCPAGLHWNDKAMVCDWPDKAGCEGGTGGSGGCGGSGGSGCSGGSGGNGGCGGSGSGGCEGGSGCSGGNGGCSGGGGGGSGCNNGTGGCGGSGCGGPSGGQCAKDSSRGYYPHPSDCNKFIQCVNGKDQEMPCPAGLHWNDKAMVCDWPDKAGCEGGSGESGGCGGSCGSGGCGGCEGGGSEGGSGGSECSNGGCGGSGGGGATEGQCAKDSGRGFYPHPSDCNKFIICDHGKDKEMTCPGNQHWNDKILACDLPEKAGCKDSSGGSGESGCSGGNGGCAGCGSGGSGCTNGTGGCGGSECGGSSGSQCAKEPNRGYYPHPSDCNKFIQCVNGKDQEMPCPAGLHWNDKAMVCDWPDKAGCEGGTGGSGGCGGSGGSGCSGGSGGNGGCGGSGSGGCEGGSGCSGGNGGCSGGGGGGSGCNNGTGGCGGSGCGGPSGGQCAKDSSRGYYPHPSDCNKFIQCVNGKDQEMPCPAGLHWNDKAMVCDWPDKAGCEGGSGESGGCGGSCGSGGCGGCESGGSGCNNGTGGCGGCGCGGSSGGQCAKDSSRGYYPHPSDCNKFIQCVNGKDQEMPCPAGLHWNDKAMVCDWPDKAGCEGGAGSPGGQCATDSGRGYYPHPSDCNKYIECVHGKDKERTCPVGQHWNDKILACDLKDRAGCKEDCGGSSGGQCSTNPGRGYYPHPSDCNKYIECVNGKDKERTCPVGQHWNDKILACDLKDRAGCKEGSGGSGCCCGCSSGNGGCEGSGSGCSGGGAGCPGGNGGCGGCGSGGCEGGSGGPGCSNGNGGCGSSGGSGGSNGNGECGGSGGGEPSGGQCAKDPSRGYYPHPSDCNKFIQCVNGKDQEMPCPAGLHWNDKAMVCDWPKNAGCKTGPEDCGC